MDPSVVDSDGNFLINVDQASAVQVKPGMRIHRTADSKKDYCIDSMEDYIRLHGGEALPSCFDESTKTGVACVGVDLYWHSDGDHCTMRVYETITPKMEYACSEECPPDLTNQNYRVSYERNQYGVCEQRTRTDYTPRAVKVVEWAVPAGCS